MQISENDSFYFFNYVDEIVWLVMAFVKDLALADDEFLTAK